ncbi:DUF2141 domain-containing protein [Sphingomonas carotinifaciens]|uniref:DUF2141 domain-containing protein n=1 Tax=Sphingomonas carotinifaciens TaxID=1166323 RepID=UPI000DDB21E0|nr:DUF2141 domain-containing protein [Sphingomonas carotinifaciens]
MLNTMMMLALSSAAAAASVQGSNPTQGGACEAGTGQRVMVTVRGLKGATGMVRIQLYDGPGFLKKGTWLSRVEAKANRSEMTMCIAAPRPGQYAIAVRHDANGNGKSDWNDGGGFSRDPKLSLLNLKPSFDKVVIPVHAGTTNVVVTMNYRQGLSIGPVD